MSYGGFLRFTVETEGGTTLLPGGVLASYPLIQIQGNDKLVLEYFPVVETQGRNVKTNQVHIFFCNDVIIILYLPIAFRGFSKNSDDS